MSTITVSEEAVTPDQRRWANAILRLAARGATERPESRGDGEDDLYGQGLRDYSIAANRPVPSAFQKALKPGRPMLSAADWNDALERNRPTPEEIDETVLRKEEIMDNIRQINQTPPNARRKIKEDAALCLKIADTPENNPEHAEVGSCLEEMEALEEKFPPPRDEAAEKSYIQAKAALIYRLQDVVFKWNNRRSGQNLPPSADAVAMADLLQRVHDEMIATVVEKGLPLPLSAENEAALSEEAKEQLQQHWQALVESDGEEPGPGRQISVKTPAVGSFKIPNGQAAQKFRMDILADFGRLLQSPAGRDLVNKLNNGKHPVQFMANHQPACGRPRGTLKNTDNKVGTPSIVKLVPGSKDSDFIASSDHGDVLFSPRFLVMGHELVHAMHNAKGKCRRRFAMNGVDPRWNNLEEYQTILKGKLSEQTLRQQYGISVGRFSHLTPKPDNLVFAAFDDILTTAEEMRSRDPGDLEATLKERQFDPGQLTDQLKLQICDSTVKGPVPPGWDTSQLTFTQIKAILGPPPLEAKLGELGWTPQELDGVDMRKIIASEERHPRSPEGLRFRTLGGDDSLGRFANFRGRTEMTLADPKNEKWPAKLEALEEASALLADLANNHEAEIIKLAAEGAGKVGPRLDAVAELFESHKAEFAAYGGDRAMEALARYNKARASAGARQLPMGNANLFEQVGCLHTALENLDGLGPTVAKAKGGGNLASQLDNVADLFRTAVEEFQQFGAEAACAAAKKYRVVFRRNFTPANVGILLFSKWEYLRAARADVAALAQEPSRDPSIVAAANGAGAFVDVLKAVLAAQTAVEAAHFKAHAERQKLTAKIGAQQQQRDQAISEASAELTAYFQEDVVSEIRANGRIGKSKLNGVVQAMDSVSVILGLGGPGDEVENAIQRLAKLADDYLQAHPKPRFKRGLARQTQCRKIADIARNAQKTLDALQTTGRDTVATLRELGENPAQIEPACLEKFEPMMTAPYLLEEVSSELNSEYGELRAAVEEELAKNS